MDDEPRSRTARSAADTASGWKLAFQPDPVFP
jgi:hypothetical protein